MPLASKLKQRVKNQINKRKYPQFGRHNAPNWPEACRLLAYIAQDYAQRGDSDKVLLIGNIEDAAPLQDALTRYSLATDFVAASEPAGIQTINFQGYCCILLAVQTAAQQFTLSQTILQHPSAQHIPLEYIAIPLAENAALKTLDHYQDGDFVSPLHMQHGQAPTEIYHESLRHFEQKTDIRDYLDLWQVLTEIKRRDIAGNIAEFGSYKGHSGYLMAKVAKHLGLEKQLYLFDMFENFPEEAIGVDRYWSNTHHVDYEEVRSKFAAEKSVTLVKGDFTQTLPNSNTGPLSFVFIDCDSYRGTQYLLH